MSRDSLNQTQKYLGFKAAFQTYSKYKASDAPLAAFVVAFSIFEDRVSACLMLAKDLASQPRPSRYLPLANKIGFLEQAKCITSDVADEWRTAVRQRNDLLHAAMWNVAAVDETHCDETIGRARKADALARRLKRQVPG